MLARRAQLLPNLITLGNAFCGVLALSKAIDALTLSTENGGVFYEKMEAACFLVFLGMGLDALDGLVARMTGGGSEFGCLCARRGDSVRRLAGDLARNDGVVQCRAVG